MTAKLTYKTYSHPTWGNLHTARAADASIDTDNLTGTRTSSGDYAWFRKDDIMRLSGIEDAEIDSWHAFIMTDSNGDEYVSWQILSYIFLRPTDKGTLDAWVLKEVGYDLLFNLGPSHVTEPEPDPVVSAQQLHAVLYIMDDFDTWADKVSLAGNTEGADKKAHLCTKWHPPFKFWGHDMAIPLDLAFSIARDEPSFSGTLASIPIIEAMAGDHTQESLNELIELGMRLIVPEVGHHQIDTRLLHEFLEVKQPYLTWIADAIEDLSMKPGRDYFMIYCDPGSVGGPRGFGVYSISMQMAKYMAMREPTRRGYLMGRHVLREEEKLNPDPQPFMYRKAKQG